MVINPQFLPSTFPGFHSPVQRTCVQWWQKHELRPPDPQQDPALGRGITKRKRWDISRPFSLRSTFSWRMQSRLLQGQPLRPPLTHRHIAKGAHLGSQSNLRSPC